MHNRITRVTGPTYESILATQGDVAEAQVSHILQVQSSKFRVQSLGVSEQTKKKNFLYH